MCKTKCDRTYNGWTNYETWAVNLWMDNSQSTQNYWAYEANAALRKDEPVLHLADRMKDEHQNAASDLMESLNEGCSVFTDLLNGALSEVNWREIAQHWIDDHRDDG
jgi:hypothetical protein